MSSNSDLENARLLETSIGSGNLLKGPEGVFRFDGQIWQALSHEEQKARALLVLSSVNPKVQSARVNAMVDIFGALNWERKLQFELGDKNLLVMENGYYAPGQSGWVSQKPDKAQKRRVQIPHKYTSANPVNFEAFLDSILRAADGTPLEDAADMKQLIYEMLGYCLVSHARWEKFFVIVGPGANGKSVIGRIAKAMVGTKNTSAIQLDQMAKPFQRSHLEGKLLNLITELDQNAQIDDGMLKAVVSGEQMTVEAKYEHPREIEPYATLMVLTNHLPRLRDYSDGVYRRSIVIPLRRQFLGAMADPLLIDRLLVEIDAITSRAMDALLGLIQNNGQFSLSATTKNALKSWRDDNDQIARFIVDCLVIVAGGTVTQANAYQKYQLWRHKTNVKGEISEHQFGNRLESAGVQRSRRAGGQCLLGVSLL